MRCDRGWVPRDCISIKAKRATDRLGIFPIYFPGDDSRPWIARARERENRFQTIGLYLDFIYTPVKYARCRRLRWRLIVPSDVKINLPYRRSPEIRWIAEISPIYENGTTKIIVFLRPYIQSLSVIKERFSSLNSDTFFAPHLDVRWIISCLHGISF